MVTNIRRTYPCVSNAVVAKHIKHIPTLSPHQPTFELRVISCPYAARVLLHIIKTFQKTQNVPHGISFWVARSDSFKETERIKCEISFMYSVGLHFYAPNRHAKKRCAVLCCTKARICRHLARPHPPNSKAHNSSLFTAKYFANNQINNIPIYSIGHAPPFSSAQLNLVYGLVKGIYFHGLRLCLSKSRFKVNPQSE